MTDPSNASLACGFVAGTLVHTKSGLTPIDALRVGDLVLSRPEGSTGEPAYRRVLGAHAREAPSIWLLDYFVSDENAVRNLVVSGNQRFFVPADGWTRADHLEPAAELELLDGRSNGIFKIRRVVSIGKRHVGWTYDSMDDTGSIIDLRLGAVRVGPPGHEEIEDEAVPETVYFSATVHGIVLEGASTFFVGEPGLQVHDARFPEGM